MDLQGNSNIILLSFDFKLSFLLVYSDYYNIIPQLWLRRIRYKAIPLGICQLYSRFAHLTHRTRNNKH